jgi:hypothetical protein
MSEVRHPHRLLNSAFSLGLGGERVRGSRLESPEYGRKPPFDSAPN